MRRLAENRANSVAHERSVQGYPTGYPPRETGGSLKTPKASEAPGAHGAPEGETEGETE